MPDDDEETTSQKSEETEQQGRGDTHNGPTFPEKKK